MRRILQDFFAQRPDQNQSYKVVVVNCPLKQKALQLRKGGKRRGQTEVVEVPKTPQRMYAPAPFHCRPKLDKSMGFEARVR